MTDANRTGFWGDQLEAVFTEIVRHARVCDVDLTAPGAVEADALVRHISETLKARLR
jgi:hypothetical protein